VLADLSVQPQEAFATSAANIVVSR